MLAPQSVSEIINRTARDVHPPLYYLVLHGWTNLFGTHELAARSLSTLAILGVLVVMFLLIKRWFGSGSARATLLLMSIAPFLIRYGQEARMYAFVAFWLTLATYLLVRAIETGSRRQLYLYSLIMALGFYTHYYSIFMLVIHWLYVGAVTGWWRQRRIRVLQSRLIPRLLNARWWAANILIGLLFLPWLPAAYNQFSRVQSGFWIPPVDLMTLPSTLEQWLRYTYLDSLPTEVRLALALAIVILVGVALLKDRLHRTHLGLLAAWAFLPPLFIFFISAISRPVYIDRYLVFSAVAFYALLPVLLYLKPLNKVHYLRPLILLGLVAVLLGGVRNVYLQSNHQMREVGQVVSQRFSPGDEVVAAELYVYFDFSYYNRTHEQTKLYAPGGVTGYGETSLLYDQPELIVRNWAELRPASGHVWIIGKVGDKDYYHSLPVSWQVTERYQAGDAQALRYWVGGSALSRL